jgi:endonuclease/exonuclease/phosphatase family metal-dependent hydrolase
VRVSVPHVTDTPPGAVTRDPDGLRDALDQRLPARTLDRNLLIGTWNIRHVGGPTEQWRAGDDDDSPKRDLHSIRVVAEIIRRFDVVAIQEIRGDLKTLRPDWGFVLTDVTRGDTGNDERLGFVFDRRTTRISGLAGELVVPTDEFDHIDPDALDRQFARTPYAVAFESGSETFVLVTLHVLWGDRPEERTPELRAIAEWLDEWARDVNAWDHHLIALGDFNIDRRGDERYDAFVSTGLEVPADLHAVPRTIFADPGDPGSHFYDQIAWFTGDAGQSALSLDYVRGGSFDFVDVTLPRRDLTRESLSWRISDHYPLWAEFSRR